MNLKIFYDSPVAVEKLYSAWYDGYQKIKKTKQKLNTKNGLLLLTVWYE
jgi:hypothetical protein